jgi:membrane protein implicated in regulation of membrane protease activity
MSRAVARDEEAIGCVGVLTVATRGTGGPGEVMVKVRGGTESFIAWSDDPLPRGATVLIIDSRGRRVVDVQPWADPVDDFPSAPDP